MYPTKPRKSFALLHKFDLVELLNVDDGYLEEEVLQYQHNVPWSISVFRDDDDFDIVLKVSITYDLYDYKLHEANWDIRAKVRLSINNNYATDWQDVYYSSGDYMCIIHRLSKEELEYLMLFSGDLAVKMEIEELEISNMRSTIMRFDEPKNEPSYVTLLVNGEKFFVFKEFLSHKSSYFHTLFNGSFQESKQSEIELKDIENDDFHNFLEVLHGEFTIKDKSVFGILTLADFYNSKSVKTLCEAFLLHATRLSVPVLFNLSIVHNLEKLKAKCVEGMKRGSSIKQMIAMSEDLMSKDDYKKLLEKAIELVP